MIGQVQVFVSVQHLIAFDPLEMAKEARKPRLNAVGIFGIGLAGAAAFLWWKRRR